MARVTYKKDEETGEWITKSEWNKKYYDGPAKRGPMIINRSFDAYESPITPGKVISTHRQRDAEMKENNCVDYEPSLRNEITKNVDNADAALELKIDREFDQTIAGVEYEIILDTDNIDVLRKVD